MMKAERTWQRHLNDLTKSSVDPLVHAMQWTRDPRITRRSLPRIAQLKERVATCRLWSVMAQN